MRLLIALRLSSTNTYVTAPFRLFSTPYSRSEGVGRSEAPSVCQDGRGGSSAAAFRLRLQGRDSLEQKERSPKAKSME